MATKRPVMCIHCGDHVKRDGYCVQCGLHINMLKKAFNTSDYYYNIGYEKAVARDLSGAIESLNMSLRYNKRNIITRNLLGLIYYEMGELVMALSHWVMSANYGQHNNLSNEYLRNLNSNPTDMDNINQLAHKYNVALEYAYNGDNDLAILQLKSAISLNSHFVKGYLLLALLFIRDSNYEKARITLRRVLRIDKANSTAVHYLHEMGDTDENIIHMAAEAVENDGLLEGFQDEPDVRPMSNRIIEDNIYSSNVNKTGRDSNRLYKNEYKEINFSKNSIIYVLSGIVLGIMILFFVIVPSQKKSLREENDKMIKQYSEELVAKNTTISMLNEEISSLNKQLEETLLANQASDNPLPDYSGNQSGMSEQDILNMINNE